MGFLGSFFGSDQRNDLKKANKKATAAIDQGLSEGVSAYETGRSRFDPYASAGTQANAMYTAALGLGGPDAQREFLANYIDDPTQELSQRAVARAMAARGLTDSGASRLASARVWQEGYNNHLNRLMGVSQQGMQAAGAQAGIDTGIGDMRFGTGQLRANQAIGYGNALAETRNVGLNNILGAAGTAFGSIFSGGKGNSNAMMTAAKAFMGGA